MTGTGFPSSHTKGPKCEVFTCFVLCLSFNVSALVPLLAQDANERPKGKQTRNHAAKESSQYDQSVPKPTLTGIKYGDHNRNVIDFWKAKADAPTPLVFVIHGGGWVGGSKERVDRFADVQKLLDAGISVAAINYRYIRQAGDLSPPVKAPLYDAARALQFVRKQSAAWNIDKQRIGAAGGSAGACSSLWLAFHDDLADPDSDDPIETRIKSSILRSCRWSTNEP